MILFPTGDFNYNKDEVNVLSKYLKQKKLKQLISWPTHDAGRTLDHLWVSKEARVQLTRHSPYYSDHDAIVLQFEAFPWQRYDF